MIVGRQRIWYHMPVLYCSYSPAYFFEELHGLADASGVDYDLLLRVHMLPELVKVN